MRKAKGLEGIEMELAKGRMPAGKKAPMRSSPQDSWWLGLYFLLRDVRNKSGPELIEGAALWHHSAFGLLPGTAGLSSEQKNRKK